MDRRFLSIVQPQINQPNLELLLLEQFIEMLTLGLFYGINSEGIKIVWH